MNIAGMDIRVVFASILAMAVVFTAGLTLRVNRMMVTASRDRIYTNAAQVPSAEAVLLLGAGVYPGNRVSQVVYDRLVKAAELYKAGRVKKILVSGDHGTKEYDEVNTIRRRLLELGIPGPDIFMDHAGFSTYDSVYRALAVFGLSNAVIVTQEFHLPRALYIAKNLGMQAVGYPADRVVYDNRHWFAVRETAARVKDGIKAGLLKPLPVFLGPVIPITGDGRASWDTNK